MKISIKTLSNYIELSHESLDQLRDMFEDVGLEVKRTEENQDDTLFTLELLANRGDHYSYLGIVQEIHGRTGWKIKAPSVLSVEKAKEKKVSISIESEKCLSYTLSAFTRGKEAATGTLSEFNSLLTTSGTNLINAAVDIGNIVGIERGQPVHIFDADKVNGKISVRETKEGETAHLLFTEGETTLPVGTLVISDATKILAVAGVIGCEEAKPTEATTRVYMESALFDPVAVRKTAKHLGLQTSASMRFERGGDPAAVLPAIDRAAYLFSKSGWEHDFSQVACLWQPVPLGIACSAGDVNDYLGTRYSIKEIQSALAGYGFQFSNNRDERFIAIVPSHRIWDIKENRDVFEEVCRHFGYNSLPTEMPRIEPSSRNAGDAYLMRKALIEEVLLGHGFFEVFTDGFYGEAQRQKLDVLGPNPVGPHVRVVNAQDRSFSLMKNNNVIQALDLVQTNMNVRNSDVKAFEWTRTFHPNAQAENGLCEERKILWLIASGEILGKTWKDPSHAASVFFLKGIAEQIADSLDVPISIEQSETCSEKDYPVVSALLHPSRKANIMHDGQVVGVIGEVHPKLVRSWGLKKLRPCYMEINQSLMTLPSAQKLYCEPKNIQQVQRDVCLLMPDRLPSQLVSEALLEGSDQIAGIAVTDVFNSEKTQNQNAVTFSVTIDPERSGKTAVTAEEANEETEKAVRGALRRFKPQGLDRR